MTWYVTILFLTSMLQAFQLFAIGSFGVMTVELWMGLLFLWLPIHLVWQGKPLRVPMTIEMGLSVAVMGIVLLSCLSPLLSADTGHASQTIKTFVHFLFIWLFFMVLVCMEPDEHDWRRALRWYAAAALIIVPFGIYQLAARAFDLPLAWLSVTNVSFKAKMDESLEIGQLALQFANFYRVTSIFSEPSGLAAYCAVVFAVVVVPVVRKGHGVFRQSWTSTAVMIMCVIAFLTAFSLTGIMLCGVTLVLLMIMHKAKITRRMVSILLASVLVVVASDAVIKTYFEVSLLELFAMRIESIVTGKAISKEAGSLVGESLTQRTGDYEASFRVWLESPVLGVGPGNFAFSDFGKTYNQPYPSTLYGSLLAEQGLIGVSLMIAFYVALFVVSWKLYYRWHAMKDLHDRHPAMDTLASVLPFLTAIIMFVSATGNMFVHAILWLQICLVMVGTTNLRRTLGELRTFDIYLVRRPWRELAIESWKGAMATPRTELHDTDHRR